MPEIRIDRIISRLIISRISNKKESDKENTREAIEEREVVKKATSVKSKHTNGEITEGKFSQPESRNIVWFVAVDKVNNCFFQSLQKT